MSPPDKALADFLHKRKRQIRPLGPGALVALAFVPGLAMVGFSATSLPLVWAWPLGLALGLMLAASIMPRRPRPWCRQHRQVYRAIEGAERRLRAALSASGLGEGEADPILRLLGEIVEKAHAAEQALATLAWTDRTWVGLRRSILLEVDLALDEALLASDSPIEHALPKLTALQGHFAALATEIGNLNRPSNPPASVPAGLEHALSEFQALREAEDELRQNA